MQLRPHQFMATITCLTILTRSTQECSDLRTWLDQNVRTPISSQLMRLPFSVFQRQLTGLLLPQLSSTQSRIKASAVHAGLSLPLQPWKVLMPSSTEPSTPFLSKTSFHAHSFKETWVAMEVSTIMPGTTPTPTQSSLKLIIHTLLEPLKSLDPALT